MTGVDLRLDTTVGYYFIGIIISVALYGCTCAQVLWYYRQYPFDIRCMKVTIAILWALDTASVLTSLQFIWVYLINNHAYPKALAAIPSVYLVHYVLSGITTIIVQCYYINKALQLLKRKWYRWPITIIMLATALISFGATLASVGLAVPILSNADAVFTVSGKVGGTLQTVGACITDILITIVLCTALTAQNTGFRHTKNLISKLTFYLLNRGILTAACQFFFFALWHIFDKRNEYVWTIFAFPGSQVYVNSMLAILNARQFVDPPKNQVSFQDIPMHYMSGLARPASSSRHTLSVGGRSSS